MLLKRSPNAGKETEASYNMLLICSAIALFLLIQNTIEYFCHKLTDPSTIIFILFSKKKKNVKARGAD